MSEHITTDQVNRALADRYQAPEFALFFEVANGTGARRLRYADAMAMSLFPSRGLNMHGFEVKVSRSDWQRELKDPHKAEEGNYRFCDHWWIVAPQGIVRPGELPSTWGLLEYASGDGKSGALRQKVAAPRLEAQPMTREFLAAFLRRAHENVQSMVRNRVNEGCRELAAKLAKVTEDNQAAIDQAVEERTTRHKQLAERVRKFELASGISLLGFSFNEQDGRLIRAMQAAGYDRTYGGLSAIANQLANTSKRIQEHLAEFDNLAPASEEKQAAE